MNRKFLLLVQEEYPNPCDSIYYPVLSVNFMDLGEVVEIHHPEIELTTPSPQADKVSWLNCGRSHPS
jgi:hypothetical protein